MGRSYSDFFTGRSYREVLLECIYRDADKYSNYSTSVTYMKSMPRSYRDVVTGMQLQVRSYNYVLTDLHLLGKFANVVITALL